MRQAKQRRAENIADKAQRMATERADRAAHDYNTKTNNSVDRARDANRDALKEEALQASVLGRQGKAIDQQRVDMKRVANQSIPRERKQLDKSIVGKRRQQPAVPSEYEDSVPPGYRRALETGEVPPQRNDPEPRFHPTARQRPSPNQSGMTRQVQHSVMAHGIHNNPVVEARRRKALEAKIQELASQ